MAKAGDWVRIKKNILDSSERADNIPKSTKETPLTMWVKGFLLDNAEIGEQVSIKTIIGRIEMGELIEVNPRFTHDFGDAIPQLINIGIKARELLYGGDKVE